MSERERKRKEGRMQRREDGRKQRREEGKALGGRNGRVVRVKIAEQGSLGARDIHSQTEGTSLTIFQIY